MQKYSEYENAFKVYYQDTITRNNDSSATMLKNEKKKKNILKIRGLSITLLDTLILKNRDYSSIFM